MTIIRARNTSTHVSFSSISMAILSLTLYVFIAFCDIDELALIDYCLSEFTLETKTVRLPLGNGGT